ncbi:GP183 protein, partial [Polyodon spathula]|nr:GP183 protein [Polyodon spathula]
MCRITTVIFYTNTYVGIAIMTCISIDRYLAMVHPHRLTKLRRVEVVRIICGLVWFLVFCQTAPLLFKKMVRTVDGKETCMEYFNFEASPKLPYLLLLACTISYCIPLGVIACCYTKINLKLFKAAKRNPITSRFGRNKRATNIILLILITFVLCFSPYHINIMQFMIRKIYYQQTCEEFKAFKMSLQVTVSIMNINCCLDPVIYFFAVKSYKQKLMSLFKTYISTSTFSSKTPSDSMFLGYVIPVVTILVCYSGLCWKLQISTKQKQFADKSGRNKKATRVIFFVTLVFVICFSPYHIDIVQHMIKKLSYDPSCSEQYAFQLSLHFTVCLMNFNSCMDPFIYFFACKGYKRKIMKILKRQVSASFSSVVKTSPDGSTREIIDNKIVLVTLNSHKNKSQNSGKLETNTTVEDFTNTEFQGQGVS